MYSTGVKNTLLTVGVTTHLNTDQYKFKIMLKSLFSPQSKSKYFFNSHKVGELKSLMQTHIREGYYYHSFANEYVETIINVDMKCTEEIDVRTTPLLMNNVSEDIIFKNITKEYKLNETLSADTINHLSCKVSTILEIIYKYIPEHSKQHTSITFTINNSSIGRVSRGRNNIIRNASGKFITFRDDDDMSVNINEITLFISAADYFKNNDRLNIMEVQEYFYKKDGTNKKRPKRALKAGGARTVLYPHQYELPYNKLLQSEITFIEAALMKCTSKFHARTPIYTMYYLTNCIFSVEFLSNYDLYFNENTVAEDSFWRFDIYRRLFMNGVDSKNIKLIPRPIYAIYEKTFSTTDTRRDKDRYYEMVSAVMEELHKKYDKIPVLMDQFNMSAMLIEKEFRVRSLVKYMLNRNNFNKFIFSKCLKMIAEHNSERIRDESSLEKYIEVPKKVWNIFRKEYRFDRYSMLIHPRLRNKFGINKFFLHDDNFECNSITCNASKGTNYFNQVNVGGENAYDRYIEDCGFAENEHKLHMSKCESENESESEDRSEKKYKCLFVPELLLLWFEQIKLKHVRRELLEWSEKEEKESENRKYISELIIEYSSECSSSDELEDGKDEGIVEEKVIPEKVEDNGTTETNNVEENDAEESDSEEINSTHDDSTSTVETVPVQKSKNNSENIFSLVISIIISVISAYFIYYIISNASV